MRNAKKTLSLVMIAIFTTFIVLSGIPAGAVTAAAAKAQVTKATSAVVTVEKTVKVSTFNVTTATNQLTTANKEVSKVKSLGKTYAKTYAALAARTAKVNKTIAARKLVIAKQQAAIAKAYADANKAVEALEKAVDADSVDLVADAAALATAQGAVTSALEYIEKLDKNSSNYKGLMARVDMANTLISDAVAEVQEAEAAAEKEAAEKAAKEEAAKLEAAAQTAAETAVAAVETAVNANDIAKAIEAGKDALVKVDAVKDVEKKAGFTARLQAALYKATPAVVKTVTAIDGTITVNFDKPVATTPAATAFTVTKTVGTTTPVAVTVSAVVAVSPTAVNLTVPAVAADVAKQSVVYSVVYNATGAAVVAPAYEVAAASVAVEAIDVNKVLVKFATAVDTTKVKVVMKQGAATQYTTCVFAEDKKSATLTAPTAIAAGDYTIVVSGLVSADVTATITIATAVAKSIEITSTQLTIGAGSVATFSVKNQYATDMAVLGNLITVAAYDVTAGAVVPVTYSATKSEFTLDLTATTTLKVGNEIRIIASYKGLTVTKTLKVVATAVSADLTLGTVAPLTGKTRISVSQTGFVLPYTLKNQFGVDTTLPITVAGTSVVSGVTVANINNNGSGVTFVSSNPLIIDPATFAVDANGKLTFNTGATAGTATITAIINASGKVATTTVVVEAAAAIKTIAISSPTALIAAGEIAKLTLAAVDQYGVTVSTITGTTASSSDNAIATVAIVNGKLEVTTKTAGTVTLSLKNTVDPTIVYGTISVKIEAAAVPTAITGITAPTTFEVTAVKDLTFDKLTAVDQYGRAYSLKSGDVTTTKVDAANTTFTVNTTDPAKVTFTAGAAAGTQAVKFELANKASYTATYSVVLTSSIVSYTINNAPTLVYAGASFAGVDHTVALAVDGKLADGTLVVLKDTKITGATSTNLDVATVDAAGVITGAKAGTTTIALWNVATKIAEITVTVSDADPVAKKVSIEDLTVKVGDPDVDPSTIITVLDQYGIDFVTPGFIATSNTAVFTLVGGNIHAVAAGTATLTFVTANGIVVTATITVE